MNQIDKTFRSKLEHHTSDIPSDAWEAVSKRLDDKERNKRPLYPFLLAALFILFSGVVFYNWDNLGGLVLDKKNTVISKNISDQRLRNLDFDAQEANATIQQASSEHSKSINSNVSPSIPSVSKDGLQGQRIQNEKMADSDTFEADQITTALESVAMDKSLRSKVNVASIDGRLKNSQLKSFRKFKLEKVFGQGPGETGCAFSSNISDRSFDAYYSNDFVTKQLTAKDQTAQGLLNMRKETEHVQYSFSAGVRFGYNVGYRWNIHTGLNYTQINEKFNYIDPESNQTRLITIKDYIYQNGVVVDSVITEEVVVVPGTTVLKVNNTYRTFDIPLLARFTILANDHFSLSAMVGPYINVHMRQQGMIINKDNSLPIDISTGTSFADESFKTQVGISLYSNVSLAYHIAPKVDVLIEPSFKAQTQSLTTDSYSINQKYNTFALSTGVRYKF